MEAEDPATLLAFYRSALLEKGDDLMLRLFFGKLCLRLEMVDEALEQLYAVESAGVDFPHLHFLLAEAHRRRNRIDESIAEYKKALGVNNRLRLGYLCDRCGAASAEWQSRCPDCGTWGSFSLAGRQAIQNARPVADAGNPSRGERRMERAAVRRPIALVILDGWGISDTLRSECRLPGPNPAARCPAAGLSLHPPGRLRP